MALEEARGPIASPPGGPQSPAGPQGASDGGGGGESPYPEMPIPPHPGDAAFPQDDQATTQQHGAADAHYNLLQKQNKMLSSVKGEVDKLALMGDAVTPEDVVKGAGKVVSDGGDAKTLAALLVDMPQFSGEALAGWVQGHAADLAQKEQALQQALVQSRHQLGVSALMQLVHHSLPPGPPPGAPPVGLPGMGV